MRVVINGIEQQVNLAGLQKIGRGGEGDVYLLIFGGKKYALKLYFRPSEEKHLKIKTMIQNCPHDAIANINGIEFIQLAWPLGICFEANKFLGFVMPYVETSLSSTLDFYLDKNLYNEKFNFAPLPLTYRIEIARNLAGVVKLLHESGHFFIDFKPQNVRIYDRYHLVSLIDCDGFSIAGLNGERFPAKSYSSEYIYPEALIKNKPPESLALKQDLFALSVVIFQLFNYGIHPFSGLIHNSDNAATTDDKVAKGYYPYGKESNPKIRPIKNSIHESLSDPIRELFDRCFIQPALKLPSVQEWIEVLEDILKNKRLVKCSSQPNSVDHIHFEGKPCQTCLRDKFSKRVNIRSKLPSRKPIHSRPSQVKTKRGVKSIPQYQSQRYGENIWLKVVIGTVIAIALLIYALSTFNSNKSQTKTESAAPGHPIYALTGSWQSAFNDGSCSKEKFVIKTASQGLGYYSSVYKDDRERNNSSPITRVVLISPNVYRVTMGNKFIVETDYKKLDNKRLKIIRKVIIKPESQEIIRNGKNLNDGTETAIINRCP